MLEMLKERKAALEAQGKKGFTLMEMLIVIAIIAILIAIAIPIFSAQLERANEAKDAANMRAAYATAAATSVTENADVSAGPVALTQTGNFEYVTENIGTAPISGANGKTSVWINVNKATGAASISANAEYAYKVDPVSGAKKS